MKRLFSVFIIVSLLAIPAVAVSGTPTVEAESALLMEKETGAVLFAKNEHAKLEPASVTKVMTLLLITEALDSGSICLEDTVTTSAHAAGMGGSQVYLKEGEQMSVHDMLKAVTVSSANDASVALAELVAGSEEVFVARMNEKAAELGMEDTTFKNCTGLPAAGHLTSAYDIALMSRELLSHTIIKKYTTIWIDSLRDGAFGLANTNKLVRFYSGTTGLKTGSTSSALYCLSATAERDGMELIAVIMKSPTSTKRFESAKSMLNFGFANYALVKASPDQALLPVEVKLGQVREIQPVLSGCTHILVEKAQVGALKKTVTVCEKVEAPVVAGQKLGELVIASGETRLATVSIVAAQDVPKLTWGKILGRFMDTVLMGR